MNALEYLFSTSLEFIADDVIYEFICDYHLRRVNQRLEF